MIVRPESPVPDMTSQVALGQTKYSKVHVAFLGLCVLKCHRKLQQSRRKALFLLQFNPFKFSMDDLKKVGP